MERFIRQKYEERAFVSGSKPPPRRTSSLSSDDMPGPPLPPKPGRRFGFRIGSGSASTSRAEKMTPPISPVTSPAKANKQSRILGSAVGNQMEDYDAKLTTLRLMGFMDDRRSLALLKSTNGDLDRTVDALVSGGESTGPPPGTITPVSTSSAATGNGLSIAKTRQPDARSTNPFDALDKQSLPQRAATMPIQHTIPASQPFQPNSTAFSSAMYSDPVSLASGFQSMQISQPGPQSDVRATSYGTNPFLPQQPANHTYPMPNGSQYQTQGLVPQSTNPFDRPGPPQPLPQANPWGQPMPQAMNMPPANPWLAQANQFVQTPQASTPQGYSQEPSQADFFSMQPPQPQRQPQQYIQPQQSNYQQQAQTNPFMSNTQSNIPPSNPFQQPFASQPQPSPNTQPQVNPGQQAFGQQAQYGAQMPTAPSPMNGQPVRHDKSSILALYNQPYLPPSQPLHTAATGNQQQRSVTMPVGASSGSMNPFAAQGNTNPAIAGGYNGNTNGFHGQPGQPMAAGYAGAAMNGQASPWQ